MSRQFILSRAGPELIIFSRAGRAGPDGSLSRASRGVFFSVAPVFNCQVLVAPVWNCQYIFGSHRFFLKSGPRPGDDSFVVHLNVPDNIGRKVSSQ